MADGEEVIDLQAVDKNVPSDLGEWLRRNNGDLTPIKALADRAPLIARRPLKGLAYALPVARPGKVICLGVNYLEHVKETLQRDNVEKFPTIFTRCQTSLLPHNQPIVRPSASQTLDYEAEMVVSSANAQSISTCPMQHHASPAIRAATKAQFGNSKARQRNGTWERTLMARAPSVPGW